MTIHELLAAAGLTANDEIPIWDADGTGEPTKKITAQQLAAAVVALANLVTSVNSQTGAVSVTPANIGAVAKTGDTMTGGLTISLGAGDGQERIIFSSPGVAGQAHLVVNTTGTQQRMTFRQFTPDGTSYEEYALPNTADYTGGPVLRNILTDKSPVTVPQGGTGATTAAVTITNDYSSVLNAINAVKGTRIFPISIQKNQGSSYSDMPSGNETDEWNLLLVGDSMRLTANLYIYRGDQNPKMYLRHAYNGAWIGNWTQVV